MPRIDPLQLLKCLSVLLNQEGGILTRTEVSRLVVLMTKFSKKLVSKCIYLLILSKTEPDLIDLFMGEGGWNLIQTWLQDAMHISNWDLVKEILSLLVITPVDVERLKLNNIPKLVKTLSKRDDNQVVSELATELVNKWLEIVKVSSQTTAETSKPEILIERPPPTTHDVTAATLAHMVTTSSPLPLITTEPPKNVISSSTSSSNSGATSPMADGVRPTTVYKISLTKDGKQVISKLGNSLVAAVMAEVEEENKMEETVDGAVMEQEQKDEKKNDKEKEKERIKERRSSSSSSSKSRSSSSSSRDKDRKKSSSSKSSSSSSSSSSSRDKDKDRDRDRKDKDKSRHNGSHSSKSSSRKDRDKDKDKEKEKQAEKDKDTLAKLKPQTLDRIGRIPKKSDKPEKERSSDKDKEKSDKEKSSEIKRKSTISIEPRKKGEDRPKTVKVFNSKMRSTGLEEEVKPPPPRPTKKPSVQLPTIPPKRPSPIRDIPASQQPPEKKPRTDIPIIERPGAIKLIPPKPKPAVLQESDIFMDALAASATTKKEPKKRKRKLSKEDTPKSPSEEKPPATPTSPTLPALKNIAPINFYQDTLSEDNNTTEPPPGKPEEDERSVTPTDNTPEVEDTPKSPKIQKTEGLKGVLLYSKKKGPKRSISWRAESDLVEVRYFELDETERVNVTKTFMDMAKMEMTSEREALQMSRKLTSEDLMEPQINWRLPYFIDQPEPLAVPGSKSLEKDIQYAREKTVLQALYFDKRRIPDSPEEPIPENYTIIDAINIPLEDAESQEIDLRNTPWPEPKGSPPHMEPPPVQFPISQFNSFSSIPPPNFVPPPRFAPHFNPNMINGMPPPNIGQPDMMNPMFRGPVPEGNFNMPVYNQPNMFPPNNFMRGAPPGANNRPGFRPRMPPPGNWVRMNGPGMPPNWNRGMPPNRGGMAGGNTPRILCKNVKNHGFCRNRDNCPFMHPA